MMNRTSIYQALSAIAPIFYLPQRVIIRVAANIHPLAQQQFLSGNRVDAVAIGKC